MATNQRKTLPESLDDGRKTAAYTDGADPTNTLRRSANEVDPVQSSITDQTSGTTEQQRRQDLSLRPGVGDSNPRDGGGPGRAV
jgi:hypothetical protein